MLLDQPLLRGLTPPRVRVVQMLDPLGVGHARDRSPDSGEKFSVTWETAEDVLIRAYSKVMSDSKTRIRLERQEYPNATLADIIEEERSW